MARPEDGDMDDDQLNAVAFNRALVNVWPPARSTEFMAVSRDILYRAVDRYIVDARTSARVKNLADSNIRQAYIAAVSCGVPVEELVGVLLLCESEPPKSITLSG